MAERSTSLVSLATCLRPSSSSVSASATFITDWSSFCRTSSSRGEDSASSPRCKGSPELVKEKTVGAEELMSAASVASLEDELRVRRGRDWRESRFSGGDSGWL